jgi:hypothetical protein
MAGEHRSDRARTERRPTPTELWQHRAVPALKYKFVELSIVTDEEIERTVNEWVAKGWTFDGIRFAMSEASRRPSMAFVSFVRSEPEDLS